MRHVKLYKKRGSKEISRIEDDDNGKRIKLKKGEFDVKATLKEIEKALEAKKVK